MLGVKRFIARKLDYSIAVVLAGYFVSIAEQTEVVQHLVSRPFLCLIVAVGGWLLVESILITLFTTTPGKWLLGLTVVTKEGGRLPYSTSFERSFWAMTRGEWFGLPVISLIPAWFSKGRLRREGSTAWDSDLGTLVQCNKTLLRHCALVVVLPLLGAVIAVSNDLRHNMQRPDSLVAMQRLSVPSVAEGIGQVFAYSAISVVSGPGFIAGSAAIVSRQQRFDQAVRDGASLEEAFNARNTGASFTPHLAREYHSPQLGFRIRYPYAWSLFRSKSDPNTLVMVTNRGSSYFATCSVSVERTSATRTMMESMADIRLGEMFFAVRDKRAGWFAEAVERDGDFVPIGNEVYHVTFAGVRSHLNKKDRVQVAFIATLRRGLYYQWLCETPERHAPRIMPTLAAILWSMKFDVPQN